MSRVISGVLLQVERHAANRQLCVLFADYVRKPSSEAQLSTNNAVAEYKHYHTQRSQAFDQICIALASDASIIWC